MSVADELEKCFINKKVGFIKTLLNLFSEATPLPPERNIKYFRCECQRLAYSMAPTIEVAFECIKAQNRQGLINMMNEFVSEDYGPKITGLLRCDLELNEFPEIEILIRKYKHILGLILQSIENFNPNEVISLHTYIDWLKKETTLTLP